MLVYQLLVCQSGHSQYYNTFMAHREVSRFLQQEIAHSDSKSAVCQRNYQKAMRRPVLPSFLEPLYKNALKFLRLPTDPEDWIEEEEQCFNYSCLVTAVLDSLSYGDVNPAIDFLRGLTHQNFLPVPSHPGSRRQYARGLKIINLLGQLAPDEAKYMRDNLYADRLATLRSPFSD